MSKKTNHTKEPVCPHCFEVIEEWWEWWDLGELDSCGVVDCPFCNQEFELTLHIKFSTEKSLDSEEDSEDEDSEEDSEGSDYD